MREIDVLYLEYPFFGARRMTEMLSRKGFAVNRKRVSRLMRVMGIRALYPEPRTTIAHPTHKKYPYLLRGLTIAHPDQVWCTDITYIPMRSGFLYLVAIMDWMSRYVLAWNLSNSLANDFCIEALTEALERSEPEIFNSDQGVQFTSCPFVAVLQSRGIKISMDGKGRALDNVFIERLWRSLKYEEVYLRSYRDGFEAMSYISDYLRFYNEIRPHQALGNLTPADVYARKSAA